MSADAGKNYHLTEVHVDFAPGTVIEDYATLDEYVKSKGISDTQAASAAARTPEAAEFLRNRSREAIRSAFLNFLNKRLTGSAPLRADVVISALVIPLNIGPEGQFTITGHATLVDIQTGKVVATLPEVTITETATIGQSVVRGLYEKTGVMKPPVERLADGYAAKYFFAIPRN